MTEPPAAAELLLLAIETGELVLLLTAIAYSSKIVEAGASATPASGPSRYGSFCSNVRMFCGMVLACDTIAVEACCRIWDLDSSEVACA